MNNPMWFIEKNFDKVRTGARVLERKIGRSARSVRDSVGLDANAVAELSRQVVQRLIMAMIELGLLSLVRQLVAGRSPARIYQLPVPQP